MREEQCYLNTRTQSLIPRRMGGLRSIICFASFVRQRLPVCPDERTSLSALACDADWIRELARQQGAWANTEPKRNRKDPICFSPYLYRARNLIERFFNKIKQCRRVATRYDKLAANYLAFIKLASIRIWLRANESGRQRSGVERAHSRGWTGGAFERGGFGAG